MKILIVEDDKIIARQLKVELEKWQYQVALIEDFTKVIEEFKAFEPHLVLMDIGLPAFNGYHWCQQIRQFSKVPIIFISSRADNMDQVMAIQMGADDYLTKPIDLSLSLAKIQALLRRSYDYTVEAPQDSYGGLSVDFANASVLYEGTAVELTHTQLQIMVSLIEAKGGFVSREAIMDHCWDQANFIDDNTLSVNISRIRKRLEEQGVKTSIQTKKGLGYALKVDENE